MGSSVISQGAGPPDGIQAPSRRVGGVGEFSCLPMGFVTVAKGRAWQLVLAIAPLLFASTAAYNEGYSTVSYQTPSGTRRELSDLLPFQNLTGGWLTAEQELQNDSTEDQLDFHSVVRNPDTRTLMANLAGTENPSRTANTQWDLSTTSGSLKSKVDGQGPWGIGSSSVQIEKNSTRGLNVVTLSSLGALTKMTGPPSNELQQSETLMPSFSLVPQAVETRLMEHAYTVSTSPTLSQTSPFQDASSFSHLGLTSAHETAVAKTFLKTLSVTDQAAIASISMWDNPPALEHITADLHGTLLSSTKVVHGIEHADHISTGLHTQTDFLNYRDVPEEVLYLKSSDSPETPGTGYPHLMSPVRTTTPRTIDEEMKLLSSSTGAAALVPMVYTSTNILSGSLTQSVNASPKTLSQQITVLDGQNLAPTEPDTRGTHARVASASMLPQSSIWPSLNHSEAPDHVTPGDLRRWAGFSASRKTKEISSHRLPKPLSTSMSSLHKHVPGMESTASVLSAAGGAHVASESYTEADLQEASHYGESASMVLPSHGLSAVAPTSSPNHTSTMKSGTQSSQWAEATSWWPPRNGTSRPVLLRSPKARSFTDALTHSTGQLAEGTAIHDVDLPTARIPGLNFSLITTPLEHDAVAGTYQKPKLSGHQSSPEQMTSLDSTSLNTLLPYLGTTKDQDSPAMKIMLSTSQLSSLCFGLKGEAASVVECPGPSEAPRHTAVSSSDTSFLDTQASSLPPLNMLYPKGDTTGYSVHHSWASPGILEASPSKGVTPVTSSVEQMKTKHHGREEKTWLDANEMLTFPSELPLASAEDTATTELALSSAELKVLLGRKRVSPGQRSGTLSPNSTLFTRRTLSKEPFTQRRTTFSATKTGSSTTVHSLAMGSTSLPPSPYLTIAGITMPAGTASASAEDAGLVSRDSADSSPVELFSMTPPEWKAAIPAPVHALAASTSVTQPGRSPVTQTHSSVSLTSPSSVTSSVPESSLKMDTGAADDMVTRKEWAMPASSMLTSISNAEAQMPDLEALTSSTAANVSHRTAPLLPTWAPEVVTAAEVFKSLATARGYSIPDTSTLATGTTAALNHSSGYRNSSGLTVAVPVSSTAELQSSPGTVAYASRPIASYSCRNGTCHTIKIMTVFIPPQSTSVKFPVTSQLLLTRRVLVTTLESDTRKNETARLSTDVTRSNETNATTLPSTKPVTEDSLTSESVLESRAPALSLSTRENYVISSRPQSPVPVLHTLPLQFHLTRIDYTESLKNKSSESYKKLEKEVTLTLNKILSCYKNFLQTNILHFLNGSVAVESETVFRQEGSIPTPSNVIRTIVTAVERRELDSFFEWRIDLKSLLSDGFSLENLEPEKLAVSFTVLGPTAAFDMANWEPWGRLRSEVIQLLGVRYKVQNVSLHEVRSVHGDLQINGEAYINTATHVDISWALDALRGLVNYSVDLSSLSINGSKLSLQVFPFSLLVTNRMVSEKLLDRSSVEHQVLARDLSDVLMHVLRKYKNLLQVAVREITGGSLMCHGDVIFQHPAPTSKDILKTLALSVGPKDYLDTSSLQVDPFSFTVAGDGLEPPLINSGVPGYGVALIVMCILVIIALPILVLLPKILGRKDKIIITGSYDPEAGIETFELDNPGFRSIEDHDGCAYTSTQITG